MSYETIIYKLWCREKKGKRRLYKLCHMLKASTTCTSKQKSIAFTKLITDNERLLCCCGGSKFVEFFLDPSQTLLANERKKNLNRNQSHRNFFKLYIYYSNNQQTYRVHLPAFITFIIRVLVLWKPKPCPIISYYLGIF
jgi:hypothetical protein